MPRPRLLTPAEWGINNRTSFVTCAAGEFVVRVYLNAGALASIHFEHALLLHLAGRRLSFATPVPERTIAGDTIAHDPDGHSAVLFRRIPGVHLQGTDDGPLRAVGTAFAELDEALAATLDIGVAPPSFDGDLARIHAQVPDLGSLPELDPVTGDEVAAAARDAEPLYASLPRQIVHGDFAFGNALFVDRRVTAILDFEFAGLDLRAMDLAAACYILTARYHGSTSWRPFVEAYVARLPLTDTEAAAIPALMSLHAAVDLVHWLGRSRAGPAIPARVAEVAARLHEVRGWRAHHGAELVDVVRRDSA